MTVNQTLGTIVLGVILLLGLTPAIFAFVGSVLGQHLRSKSKQRRDLLLERVGRANGGQLSQGQPKANSDSDEDWEKIGERENDNSTSLLAGDKQSFGGIVAFFHPFCNAGGGGERVLFAAIQATQRRYPRALCVVYTGDQEVAKDVILSNCTNRFNLDIEKSRVEFLYLGTREWVVASKWPHFTLLGQSLGSIVLAWEAFSLLVPDVFIDTMGYAFALWLSKWLFPSVPTAAYVHYPTISTDMLASLYDEVDSNKGAHAGRGKGTKGKMKAFYWEVFAKLYSIVGGSIDVVMTNSTWTQNHITALWGGARVRRRKEHAISVVYPPCAVTELEKKIPVSIETESQRTTDILYIAQFRPEKMHDMVIDAFISLLKDLPPMISPTPKLILVGSVRDDGDEKRVYKLRLQAREVQDRVEFRINAKWDDVLQLLKTSSVGVNGMWNEHFGIGVVEYQAAGLISVVNDSGGPKYDIVTPVDTQPTGRLTAVPEMPIQKRLTVFLGFRASSTAQFTEGFKRALSLPPQEATAMRLRARHSALRFSEDVFSKAWITQLDKLVENLH